MKKYIVTPGQSLFDVAVSAYGNVTGVAWLIADNHAIKGPTDRLYEGQVLLIRPDLINVRAKIYLQDHPVVATISDEDLPEGIGYWSLEEYEVQNDLQFMNLSYASAVGGRNIFFALSQSGTYDVVFRNMDTSEARTYNVYFTARVIQAFGYFEPGSYRIEILTIHTQITVL